MTADRAQPERASAVSVKLCPTVLGGSCHPWVCARVSPPLLVCVFSFVSCTVCLGLWERPWCCVYTLFAPNLFGLTVCTLFKLCSTLLATVSVLAQFFACFFLEVYSEASWAAPE